MENENLENQLKLLNGKLELAKKYIELSTINFLYSSIKNPYNGVVEDREFIISLDSMISLCALFDVHPKFDEDPSNTIMYDMKVLYDDIKEDIYTRKHLT